MADLMAQHVERELAIELCAIKQVADEVITIRARVGLWLPLQGLTHASVNISVRCLDGNMAHAVIMFFEQGAELVALFGGVSFFQEWIANQPGDVAKRLDDWFVTEKVRREISVAGPLQIHL